MYKTHYVTPQKRSENHDIHYNLLTLKPYLDKHFEKKKLFLTWDKLYFFYSIHHIPTKQERYEAKKKTKWGQTMSR